MPLLLYILFLYLFIIYVWLRNKTAHYVLKLKVWVIISYGLLLIIHFFSGIKYEVASIARILPYFILCISLVLTGEYLASLVKWRSFKSFFKIKISTLAYSSFFGATLYVGDILNSNQVTFGLRIDDLQTSLVGVIGNAISSLGLIAWLASLYNNRIRNVKIPISSYLSIISFISGGVLSAGRQAIIIITLCSFIMYVWSRYRTQEIRVNKIIHNERGKKPFGMILILGLFIGYFLFISAFRNQILDIEVKVNTFERLFSASIAQEDEVKIMKMQPFSDIYVESIFYYSHQLRRLDLTFEHYDYMPLFGLGQLSYVERRLQWLIGKQRDISWKKMEEAIEGKGHFGLHTWGTFIVNYIVDFGRYGTLIACFFTGVVFGRSISVLRRRITIESIIHQIILLSGVVFSIQFSPLAELIWTFPLIFSSLVKIDMNAVDIEKKPNNDIKLLPRDNVSIGI